jgi:hypothetical protein
MNAGVIQLVVGLHCTLFFLALPSPYTERSSELSPRLRQKPTPCGSGGDPLLFSEPGAAELTVAPPSCVRLRQSLIQPWRGEPPSGRLRVKRRHAGETGRTFSCRIFHFKKTYQISRVWALTSSGCSTA